MQYKFEIRVKTMNLNEQCTYSYYVPVAPISEEHNVWLVQHAQTAKFYVRKTIQYYYNVSVFRYLKSHPIPDMPRILEVFEDENTLHIIEEYISGETLEELLAAHGTFSEQAVTDWIRQLCRILSNLHHCSPPIIHRDIKSSNIILTSDGRIKLLDLSAARQDSDRKSQDTVIMGTAGYAAPEQYGFSSSSEVTDIYSVGILMNKLLTGKLLSEQVYSGSLSDIIEKCTQLEPAKRYKNVEELDRDLSSHTAVESHRKEFSKWQYLPPGFRSGNVVLMFLAFLGYFAMLSVTLTMKANTEEPRLVWANRITATVIFLGITFLTGNYLDCQSRLPLARSNHPVIRAIGIVLWDAVIFLGCIIVGATFS